MSRTEPVPLELSIWEHGGKCSERDLGALGFRESVALTTRAVTFELSLRGRMCRDGAGRSPPACFKLMALQR